MVRHIKDGWYKINGTVAANYLLSLLTLSDIRNNPLIPLEVNGLDFIAVTGRITT